MTKKAKIAPIFPLILLLFASNLWAGIIKINLTAEITHLDDPSNLLNSQISLGDTIIGSYTYESSALDSSPLDGVGFYLYNSAAFGITLNAGEFNFQTNPVNVDFTITILNNHNERDSYSVISSRNLPLDEGVDITHIGWFLSDYSSNAISSDELLLTAPVLSDWPLNLLDIDVSINGGCSFRLLSAHVITAELVPEPATILLLGLGALAILKNRKK